MKKFVNAYEEFPEHVCYAMVAEVMERARVEPDKEAKEFASHLSVVIYGLGTIDLIRRANKNTTNDVNDVRYHPNATPEEIAADAKNVRDAFDQSVDNLKKAIDALVASRKEH